MSWEEDCMRLRGVVLTGKYGHCCDEFDGLPVDETCGMEWQICGCSIVDRDGRVMWPPSGWANLGANFIAAGLCAELVNWGGDGQLSLEMFAWKAGIVLP